MARESIRPQRLVHAGTDVTDERLGLRSRGAVGRRELDTLAVEPADLIEAPLMNLEQRSVVAARVVASGHREAPRTVVEELRGVAVGAVRQLAIDLLAGPLADRLREVERLLRGSAKPHLDLVQDVLERDGAAFGRVAHLVEVAADLAHLVAQRAQQRLRVL